MVDILEKDRQLQICEYLALRKHFFWRQNTAPTIQKTGDKFSFRRMPKYSMTGVPDILVIFKGNVYGLEVKREKTKQSEGQIIFEKGFVESGGIYVVVRTVEDIQALGL